MFTSIAIIGRPNVGKSSLFNKLTSSRDAIVSDFSGLTKDRNYGLINLNQKQALLIDTGGIANKKDSIDESVSRQAWIAVDESSLIILMLDNSEELNKEDYEIISKLRKLDKRFITVLNKIDKKTHSMIKEDLFKIGIKDFIEISAEHSTNIAFLKKLLAGQISDISIDIPYGQKVAILGRPNAGKSTFINKLIDDERLIVSEVAGTTIDSINVPFSYNNQDFILIDTAGIRKGYKYNHKVEYFSFIRAMHSIDQSDLVIFMCDAGEGLVDQDLKIINLIAQNGKPILFALNKIDLISKQDIKNIYNTKRMQSEFMNDIHKVEISAIKKIGFKKVFNLTTKLIEKSQSKFSTSQLNNLLEKFLISSSPPSVGGRTLKFKHVHFAGICPTTFIINANQDKKIPRNYKKYLENSFKESLDLKSIQLRLIFKKSENPYANKKNQLTDRQVKKRKRLIKYKNKLKK